MLSPHGRLAVFSLLFVAWMTWLGYLVSKTRDPIVVSEPQILVSNYVAILSIAEEDGKPACEAIVLENLKQPAAGPALSKKLAINDLPNIDVSHGWRGPGNYVVPLTVMRSQKNILITPVPKSPGFLSSNGPDLRVYPAIAEAVRQVRSVSE